MFRPLLAAKPPKNMTVEELVTKFQYPLFASPKSDGIRAMIRDRKLVSRKLIEIPNEHVSGILSHKDYEGLDGELVTGPPTDPLAFRRSQSAFMSEGGQPDFNFYIFDHCQCQDDYGFARRHTIIKRLTRDLPFVKVLRQTVIHSPDELLDFEKYHLDQGWEGVIARSLNGLYKNGRSTVREGTLCKVVRTIREEAVIIGFEERMFNGNEATRDELGRVKRSSHKANLRGRGDLGALIVKSPQYAKPFKVGTGFDDAERADIWQNRPIWLGATITFSHKPYGSYDVPRQPVFVGKRDKRDS